MENRIRRKRVHSRDASGFQVLSIPLMIVLFLGSSLPFDTTIVGAALPTNQADARTKVQRGLPLAFERNIGQGDPSVEFEAHTFTGSLAFRRDSIEFSLPDPSGNIATVRLHYIGSNPPAL